MRAHLWDKSSSHLELWRDMQVIVFLCTDNFRNFIACSRFSDSGEDVKVKGTKSCSPHPIYFRLRAFSIQRTQLSRSLEQARNFTVRAYLPLYELRVSPLTFSDGKIIFFFYFGYPDLSLTMSTWVYSTECTVSCSQENLGLGRRENEASRA